MDVVAYAGSTNVYKYGIASAGVDVVFTTQRVVVIACGAEISTDTSAVTYDGPVLSIKFGQLDLEPGVYPVIIKVYQAGSLDWDILVGPGLPVEINLQLRSVECCC